MGVILKPWSFWNQYKDFTVDGQPDENALNNCGPESVSEVISYLFNLNIPADYIKDRMYGESYTGYTDFSHLAGFLQNDCHLDVGILSAHTPQILTQHIKVWLDNGWPNITLFYADPVNKTGGHFSPTIGYNDDGSMVRANTIGGVEQTYTELEWYNLIANQNNMYAALCINRKRCV